MGTFCIVVPNEHAQSEILVMVTSLSLLCSLVAVSVAAITSVSDASKEVLQIGALLPSNSSSNDSLWSSFRSVDACYLAVDHVNDYSGLLPNHELRLIFRETMVRVVSTGSFPSAGYFLCCNHLISARVGCLLFFRCL